MKEYLFNKQPKDPRMLATFRKSFSRERLKNGFSVEEASNQLGMSEGTLEQKLKLAADARLTWDEVSHHMRNSKDYSVLEYEAFIHGFELKKLNINIDDLSIPKILNDADNAMQESNEAWGKIKSSLRDQKLSKKEKLESLREITEAVKALQLLYFDVEHIEIEE